MNNSHKSDVDLARVLWNFNVQIDHAEPADLILVLGSNDIRVAQRGAQLFQEGYAPYLFFSGNAGRFTAHWDRPEAEIFADEAFRVGIPKEKVFIENQSRNTGENIVFSQRVLRANGLFPHSYIVVQKPYMLQRARATFKKYLPDTQSFFTAPQLSFDEYPNQDISLTHMIENLVGSIDRLKTYPQKGFQIAVDIPEEVDAAFQELIVRGYTGHLPK